MHCSLRIYNHVSKCIISTIAKLFSCSLGVACCMCIMFPGAPPCPPQPSEFASSDYVRMELDMEIFEMLQQTHGGWNPAMADVGGESVDH